MSIYGIVVACSTGLFKSDSRRQLLNALLPVLDFAKGVARVVDSIQNGAIEVSVARGYHGVEDFVSWVEAVNEGESETLD
jgi:hypothetical protein